MRIANNITKIFNPQTYTVVVFILLFSLFLTGCNKTNDDEFWFNYIKEKDEMEEKAMQKCQSHIQSYLLHHYDGLKWELICYQTSPYRHFYYDLE